MAISQAKDEKDFEKHIIMDTNKSFSAKQH